MPEEEIQSYLERLREKAVAEKTFKLNNDKETNVTISLGVSTYPFDGDTPSKLIEIADKRLYNAKNNGRNQVGK